MHALDYQKHCFSFSNVFNAFIFREPFWVFELIVCTLCAIQNVCNTIGSLHGINLNSYTCSDRKQLFIFYFWRSFRLFGNHLQLITYKLCVIYLVSVNSCHSIILNLYICSSLQSIRNLTLHFWSLFNLLNFGRHFEFFGRHFEHLSAILNW